LGERWTRTLKNQPLWTRNVLRAATLHFFDDGNSGSGNDDQKSKIATDIVGKGDMKVSKNVNRNNNNGGNSSSSLIISSKDENSHVKGNSATSPVIAISPTTTSTTTTMNKDKNSNNNSNDNDDNNNSNDNDDNVAHTSGHVASILKATLAVLSAEIKSPTLNFQKEVDADTNNVVAARQALLFAAPKQATTAISTTNTTTATTTITDSISSKSSTRRSHRNSKSSTSRSLRNATSTAIDANFDLGGER
jgi:hypothetical protein